MQNSKCKLTTTRSPDCSIDTNMLLTAPSRDWKKLTFYYFADTYINFNSLVVDLFKIYKTRIWMSAINPASFASSALGIQAPSGIGPGAVGVNRTPGGERRQTPQSQDQQPQAVGRNYRPAFTQSFAGDRVIPSTSTYSQSNYAYGNGPFNNNRNNVTSSSYTPSLSSGTDNYAGGFGQRRDFQTLGQSFTSAQNLPSLSRHTTGVSPLPSQHDWSAAFQGLSLNTP